MLGGRHLSRPLGGECASNSIQLFFDTLIHWIGRTRNQRRRLSIMMHKYRTIVVGELTTTS
jgi:hypothetical protein